MPLTPPPGGAIFDFDGVIIDSLPAVASAMNGALRRRGLVPRPAAELERFIGPPTHAAFAELTGEAEDSTTVAACVADYLDLYGQVYLQDTLLIDGIAELLAGLALPVALATSKPARFVAPLLRRFDLSFGVVSAPEVSEPKAQTVARAMRDLAVPEPVVIGDRHYDIDAARACGLRVVAVTWGVGERAELLDADAIVERPEQIAALLAV